MTDNERRRIFGLARELGINRDELHILVNGVTGCTSITELNKKQTYAVIKELNDRIKLSANALSASMERYVRCCASSKIITDPSERRERIELHIS